MRNTCIYTHSDPSIMREAPNHVILISLDNTSKHLCLPALSRLSPSLWPVLSSTLLLASSWGFNKSFGWILSSGLMLNAFVTRIGSVFPLVLLFPPADPSQLLFEASTELPYFWHLLKESGKKSIRIDFKSI